MATNRIVIYHCESCGGGFEAEQGSRQRYCSECLFQQIKAGKRIDGKTHRYIPRRR